MGTHLLVNTESKGAMPLWWCVTCGVVASSTFTDSACHGCGREIAVVDSLSSKIATDVSIFVTDRGGNAGLTSRGVSGAGDDKYENQSVFLTQTRQGNLGHFG